MIEFRKVTKTFGDITAVEDASFDIGKGEFVFVTGPSGAGKTTLLKLILRDYLPDTGEILFEGEDITSLPRDLVPNLRQNIGVVFQDFKVLPERTVRENTEVALAVIGNPESEWEERVNHVLKLVGLDKRADLFPAQLSGGELQRVSLARALVVNPKVILADEPTGNLDWDTADSILELLEKINDEGKTVMVATHHILLVDKLKKREIKLKEGKMVGDIGKGKKKAKERIKEPPKKEEKGEKETEGERPEMKVEEVKGKN